MSDLSPWLQSHGFGDNPFEYPTAEESSREMLQATYVYDRQLENLMFSSKSAAFLAPYGGGKTAARYYLRFRWDRKWKQDTLIVVYDNFELLTASLPILSLNNHVPSLMRALAKAVWDFLMNQTDGFMQLFEPGQLWWWAFLDTYLPRALVHHIGDSIVLSQSNSYQTYQKLKEKKRPFKEDATLIDMLSIIVKELAFLQLDQILILVDGVDGQDHDSQQNMEEIIRPLMNNLRLYSDKITWKFFLPDSLKFAVRSSSAARKQRLDQMEIQWDQTRLQEFLRGRLAWASDEGVHSLTALSEVELIQELPQLEEELLEALLQEMSELKERPVQEIPDLVDKILVQLVLQNQDLYGIPRTLLWYGRQLVFCLETRKDDLVTKAGWQEFRDSTNVYLAELVTESSEQAEPLGVPELFEILVSKFSLEDIRNLCVKMGINFEELPGENTISSKARELVLYCERQGHLPELKKLISRLRPRL